jgi:hypothetical protein
MHLNIAARVQRPVWLRCDTVDSIRCFLGAAIVPGVAQRTARAAGNRGYNCIGIGVVGLHPRALAGIEYCREPAHTFSGVNAPPRIITYVDLLAPVMVHTVSHRFLLVVYVGAYKYSEE